jgi:hypothetical protein
MTGADHQDRPKPAGVGAALAGAALAGADLAGGWLPLDGLSWSWEVDLEALLAAVSDLPACQDADAGLAEYLEAVEAGRSRVVPLTTVAARAAATAAGDAEATGGCAHAGATTAYRPTQKLGDYVTARDQTCRFPTCRQPAARCDLDHTIPFDQGGRTCPCNLGALCRFHHQIKQHPRWHLAQATPGTFTWTTPTGRTYTTQPDSHAA